MTLPSYRTVVFSKEVNGMHEAGIMEELFEAVQLRIRELNIGKVKKIYLRLGDTAGLSEESLKFWFSNLSKGTELEGVFIEVVPVRGRQISVDSFEEVD
jgi:Zn finger protein HypA/HybF involved in hydrogenase expression